MTAAVPIPFSVLHSLFRPVVSWLMLRSLRRTFRRVCWVGEPPDLPADRPVVAYANHHYFHDGYLAWLVLQRVLDRPGLLWMREWDRYPFFRAVGALPFPDDAPSRRAATIRHTARRMREHPETVLIYFPEGRLRPPERGIDTFDTAYLHRLDRVLPDPLWWPLAMHVTWWGEPHPTALLGAGPPASGISGEEPQILASVVQSVRTATPGTPRCLLDGRRPGSERWSFRSLRPLFRPRS